ncbi:MAG: peptidylprolyl isomerase [Clostridia bacterium]|nr:peptidylprolyl isomerase [Clostridia bacterium]
MALLPTCAAETAETESQYPVATITMEDGGEIVLELYPDVAPNTVANFISLANSGFYDGLTFHRVISGFMIQGGDPNGDGTGGPGYSIQGEFYENGFANDLSHTRGVISMARSSMPDSAGSQFFIMHGDAPYLDGAYAAFGKVTEGMDVVDAIAAVDTNASAKPVIDQVISSIRVETWDVEYEVEKIQ